ncbi:MAG: type II toxin-antitoxin system Phd/YefM family antitoxin [Candidatus Binatia bacterium]
MKRNLSASEARANLYRLVDEVAEAHEPVYITGKRSDAVLVAAEDWNAVQETLYLLSIPGMRESIVEGMRTPISKTSDKPGW